MKKSTNNAGDWIKAARLRTLPLALAVSGAGNLIAYYSTHFQWIIVIFSILTTLLLQILSNFANDLGDSIHGADHSQRKGPERMVQSGALSLKQMKNAVKITALFSLISGLALLWLSFSTDWVKIIPILAIGILAIAAAYFYTNGKKPYGYQALGDISVFIFFGIVACAGTQYLHLGQIDFTSFWPSIAMGCWSTAVLNLNNMRDIESDQLAGKETIPSKIGLEKAKTYHYILVGGGLAAWILFGIQVSDPGMLGALPGIVLILKTLPGISKGRTSEELDLYLKPQAIGTFISVSGIVLVKIFLN